MSWYERKAYWISKLLHCFSNSNLWSDFGISLFGLEFAMKPFDPIFDVIRKNLGDKSNKDQIRAMDRDQLEFIVNLQKDAMHQMKKELAMYKKTSKSQYF